MILSSSTDAVTYFVLNGLTNFKIWKLWIMSKLCQERIGIVLGTGVLPTSSTSSIPPNPFLLNLSLLLLQRLLPQALDLLITFRSGWNAMKRHTASSRTTFPMHYWSKQSLTKMQRTFLILWSLFIEQQVSLPHSMSSGNYLQLLEMEYWTYHFPLNVRDSAYQNEVWYQPKSPYLHPF